MSSKVWTGILGAAAISAAVGIYYLAQEEELKITYDPKIHTKEKLIEVLKSFEVEYASLYLHWYTMLKGKEKEVGKGNIPADQMEPVIDQIKRLTEDIDEELYAEYHISRSFLQSWVQKFSHDPEVKRISSELEKNFDRLWRIEKPIFDFFYPPELTKELYIKYIKASYEKFRYDVYHEIQKYMRQTGKKQIDEDEFNEAIKKWSLPEIKIKVYRLLKIPDVPGEAPTKTALKAYLSMMQEDEAWHKEILGIQKDHKAKLFQLPSGGKPDSMHEDPLVVLENEIKFGKAKELPKENVRLVNLDANPAATDAEAAQKSFGSFSFLGNEDSQKKLVEEFLNRNKKQKEDTSKVEEIKEDNEAQENKDEQPKPEDDKKDEENEDEQAKPEGVAKESEDNADQDQTAANNVLPQTIPVETDLPIDSKIEEEEKEAIDEPNEENDENKEDIKEPTNTA